ncbi:MAG TPA: hypothetical protein VK698_13005, partial [Kofleriaceae bacterium]|nr:hypothetical protein [Kofleriaceae bacterium]
MHRAAGGHASARPLTLSPRPLLGLAPGLVLLVLILGLVLVAGCPTRDVTSLPLRRSGEQVSEIPASVRPDLDLLFVIDNSSSMAGEQQLLGENFPRFIEKLGEARGGLPDLHLGVVSSDLGIAPFALPARGTGGACEGEGDRGRLLRGPPGSDCPLAAGDRFLRDSIGPGGRDINYPPGELAATFACMAELGVTGCGFEQHLEAMRRALDDNPDNAGFVRDDALLAIVLIADEDDCSARDPALFDPDRADLGPQQDFRCFEYGVECDPDRPRQLGSKASCAPRVDSELVEPVETYVDFLRELKGDEGRIVVAGIVGDGGPVVVAERGTGPAHEWTLEPTCTTPDGGLAEAAVRQRAFIDAFPARSTAQTICPADGDLSSALTVIGQLVGQVLGSPCIPGRLRDGDDQT